MSANDPKRTQADISVPAAKSKSEWERRTALVDHILQPRIETLSTTTSLAQNLLIYLNVKAQQFYPTHRHASQRLG